MERRQERNTADFNRKAEIKLDHSPDRKLHIDIMRDIARDIHDLPMVLKVGTALLLCYGLDRFSEDLDFDSLRNSILPRV